MSFYHKLISEATGVTEPDTLEEIEDYMRDIIFHSTLDWQTKKQLTDAAKTAWGDIQWMRSPEGIAYMEELKNEILK